jgi:hypothetical protein
MYINGKTIPVESIPGMGKKGCRRMEGVNSSMIYLIYFKNFSTFHYVLTPSKTIKNIVHNVCTCE